MDANADKAAIAGPDAPGSPSGGTVEPSAPGWELIGAGRYQPRRTRGSCVGRALG
jgi:hypothetical protein